MKKKEKNQDSKLQEKNQQSKIILVFGKRGQGKTTLTKKLIKNEERLIVFDFHGEYQEPIILGDPGVLKVYLSEKTPYRFRISQRFELIDVDYYFEIFRRLRDYTLVLEEVDSYCKPYGMPPGLQWLIQYGRHTNVTIIATSRRPHNVSRDLTAQAYELYTFRFTEPRDVKYIVDTVGQKGKEVSQLKDHEHIKYVL